ncbi:MAG: rRNA maturation RNase YbeY [Desulfobacteraceae bacterium 4572_130]|nr:MAG: rRNA maturation RNase YbeY [Desulfobacteraceae bacterium 4572_130]
MKLKKIQIQIQMRKKGILKQTINNKTKQILSALGYENNEISIVMTGDNEIKKLNNKFRGISKPTNVLAFPMLNNDFSLINPELLGDIVISVETAEKEAQKFGISLGERISQLLIHGILHLIGFDHEAGKLNADKMRKKSLELIQLIEKNSNVEVF